MEKEQRVFLAYRAAFEGSNALIRQQKAIQRLVSKHRESAKTLLQSLGEKQVIETLKTLLERKVFQSELEAKLAFPELFTISPSQNVQHIASEADAARSEAEALDDVLSLGGDGDVALDEIADGATPVLTAADVTTRPPTNNITILSLYPIYIPYKIQHLVLSRAQSVLEECCYEFTVRWLPNLLEDYQWDCPEAIELNKWTYLVKKRLGKLPAQAFAKDSVLSSTDGLTSINKLRHSAVHRLPTTAKGISEMIRCAARFARSLHDSARGQQLEELKNELEGKIRALELNKNFLETKLDGELREIARQRKELDEKEKDVISTMQREDKDLVSLIGGLLSTSVKQILKKCDDKEPDVMEAERSSDQDTEVEKEQGHARLSTLGHRKDHELCFKDQPVSAQELEHETHEPEQDHQPLFEGKGRSQALTGLSAGSETDHEEKPDCSANRSTPTETRQTSNLDPQQTPTPESELAEQCPTAKDQLIGSDIGSTSWNSPARNLGDHSAARRVHDSLTRSLPQEIYTEFVKAVDNKLATYNFQPGGITTLSDKRLRRVQNSVKKQTMLDTALHQHELDSIIRLRFTAFQSEQRPPSDLIPRKKKRSGQPKTQAALINPESCESYPGASRFETQLSPLQDALTDSQPHLQNMPLHSPSPLQDERDASSGLIPTSKWTKVTLLPVPEGPDASEPKAYQLMPGEAPTNPGKQSLLRIDSNSRVCLHRPGN